MIPFVLQLKHRHTHEREPNNLVLLKDTFTNSNLTTVGSAVTSTLIGQCGNVNIVRATFIHCNMFIKFRVA